MMMSGYGIKSSEFFGFNGRFFRELVKKNSLVN
jgi:hypothetical protein